MKQYGEWHYCSQECKHHHSIRGGDWDETLTEFACEVKPYFCPCEEEAEEWDRENYPEEYDNETEEEK